MKEDRAAPSPTPPSGRNSSTLSLGTAFGRYQILLPLGAGGMGEVYRARDVNLGRDVAIKVLPADLCSDVERLERFEREARSASALNHPNIITIYELGQVDSIHYISMELVEGQTLRQLLVSNSIPLRKIIQIAPQVADGLAKAHEAGIIHRDLKPENLMVSNDGFLKILDFGLAKLAVPQEEDFNSPTLDGAVPTRPGVLMGTVGYMSPEQVSGAMLDFRSDQFSFGVVLYEMLTGKHPFRKNTEAARLAAILQQDPEPIGSLNPEAPAPLCWAVERCLAKKPEKRYASTRDLARDLAAIRDHLSKAPRRYVETRPSNLPPQRTAFVGREKEAAAVKELLLRPETRLVTVTGLGGIGKTRLALRVAADLTEDFPAGVYFVPLEPVSDPGLIPSVIAQTVGVRETAGQPPLEALKEHLQSSPDAPMLLLLDNLEHLASAAPLVAELMALGPSLRLLVTSRAPLRVYGEREFPLPLLSLPDPRSLPSPDGLMRYSAVALFLQRAAAVKPDFQLTKDNASAVVEICSRLDGLPLAIELAAARVKLLSPSAMRAHLANCLQLLTGGARDLPTRQQTLRKAFDWSYDLLSEAERQLFRRLSVFPGGCTLEAVEAVCNTKSDLELDLLDGMAAMVDQSLVQRIEPENEESRFVMLETIRQYGLEKLTASGEAPVTKRAHAAYCLVLAEEGAFESATAEHTKWLNRFEIEHDNFRAALDWLTENGQAEWGLRLGAALFRFWERREYFAEGRDRLQKLLDLPQASAGTKLRTRALFAAGVLAAEQGDLTSADKLYKQGLGIARELDDKQSVAILVNALAASARERGDLATSRSLFEENMTLLRELRDELAVARSLSNLANVVKLQGDFARARSLYQECLVIFQELGDQTGVARSLNYQGDVAREQGDPAAARDLYEKGLHIFRRLGDRLGIAGSLADLGNLACEQGAYPAAHSLHRESLRIFQDLQHKRGIARLLESVACSAAAQAQPERSLQLAGAAAALRQSVGAPLTSDEQAMLEKRLEAARQAVNDAVQTAAWLEGWGMPVEKAIEEALTPQSTDP